MTTKPLLLLVLVLVLAPGAIRGADDAAIEADADHLEGMLMAPCCGATTLAMHDSAPAHRMKDEIRSLLRAGRSESEILEIFVERHGTTILAMPPARGFDLAAYLLPVAMLFGGGIAIVVAMRRWRRRPVHESPDRPAVEFDDAWRKRLERELERYG